MAHDAQGSSGSNLLVMVAIALIAFAGGYVIGNKGAESVQPGAAVEAGAQGAAALARGGVAGDSDKIPIGDSPVFGNPSAPIAVVEFSSMQCPFCARGSETLKQLQQKYPNDVKLVFKHYPLGFQAESPALSKALIAAGEQGKFWEMKEKVFANVSKHKGVNVKEVTSGYAKELGLDVAKFQAAFDNPKNDEIIKRDQDLGNSIGVRGTPHFFVNGERVSGAQPLAKFEEIVKAQLEQVKKHTAAGVAKDQVYGKMVAENFKDTPSAPSADKPAAPATVVNMVPVRANDPMKGNTKDPLVTIVEFSDFQCPFCSRVNPTLEQVMKNYGEQVRIVFKQNPLPFHQEAPAAHEAALAAHEQGKFWEMHDLLFANMQSFKGADMRELTTGYAQQLGLNVNKFKAYLDSGKGKQIVKEDLELGSKVGARGTPNFFVNGVQLVGAKPYPAFEAEIKKQIALAEKLKKERNLKGEALYEAVVAENKKNAPAAAAPTPAPAAAPDKVDPSKLNIGNAVTRGPKNAPVTIFAFSDFQCPFCARAAGTIEEVMKEYDGKVQLVFKAYPLPFHQEAPAAHRAALAAAKQGKFWEMHDKLFATMKEFKTAGHFEKVAQELGLNMEKFKADFNSDELKKQVDAEMAEGSAVGVRGTPAFFINGNRVVGAQPLPKFKEVIDAELAKKK
ncbi:thioredoxin [Microvenator marinus]|uniref:Thioredoxin n=1 Tax=Microvenator marinus TaxID=2600177 RepID=A0A5B8XXY5_9DELT|nr:thioredoxin domain-containing protein [Microvenator marinus]QED28903.1 thioredoxin [Microvenator marinus]